MRTSRARTSRPLMRKAEPASRSMRRVTSKVSCALNSAGAWRSELSIKIVTSAVLRAGRVAVPEKITSSMAAARMLLCEVSPMTQRSASSRFDLPQPLGPTTPVNPFSITSSVGSTKDLKPNSRRRLMCMGCVFLNHGGRHTGACPRLPAVHTLRGSGACEPPDPGHPGMASAPDAVFSDPTTWYAEQTGLTGLGRGLRSGDRAGYDRIHHLADLVDPDHRLDQLALDEEV